MKFRVNTTIIHHFILVIFFCSVVSNVSVTSLAGTRGSAGISDLVVSRTLMFSEEYSHVVWCKCTDV